MKQIYRIIQILLPFYCKIIIVAAEQQRINKKFLISQKKTFCFIVLYYILFLSLCCNSWFYYQCSFINMFFSFYRKFLLPPGESLAIRINNDVYKVLKRCCLSSVVKKIFFFQVRIFD